MHAHTNENRQFKIAVLYWYEVFYKYLCSIKTTNYPFMLLRFS